MEKIDLKQKACQYLAKGLSVFPVDREKKPTIGSWKEYQDRLPTGAEIDRWFDNPRVVGIAMACGRVSGISVIDVDINKETGELPVIGLPPTLMSKTGGGGNHYLYKYDSRVDGIKKLQDFVDLRSQGNYIILPPSLHESGRRYEWLSAFEDIDFVDDLADFPIEMLPERSNSIESGEYKNVELQEFYEPVGEGERNNRAASFAGWLISRSVPSVWDVACWRTLVDWNAKMCKPPLPEWELRQTFESIKDLQRRNPSGINKLEGEKGLKGLVKAQDSGTFSIVDLVEVMGMEIEDFPYIVDRMVPEKAITAISGETGKGKSIFMLILLRAIITGEDLFGTFKVKKSKVLIIDQEMDRGLIADRVQAIFHDVMVEPGQMHMMYEQFLKIDDAEHYEWLKSTIVEGEYDVLVLDTWVNVHNAAENSSDEIKIINELLLTLIYETGVTILFLHHKRKSMEGNSSNNDSARGSSEIIAKVASHLSLSSKKEYDDDLVQYNEMKITQTKSRRPESIDSISFDVYFDEEARKTWWEYKGDTNEQLKAKEVAREAILSIFRYENEVEELDKKEVKVWVKKKEEEFGVIGVNRIEEALKSLVKEEWLIRGTGGERNNKNIYKLNGVKERQRIVNNLS